VSRTSTGSSSPPSPERRRVQEQLRAAGVRPDRELGQSFLVDPYVADAEAALVELPKGAPVVEIGPGLGALTEALLRRGLGPITVLEKDRRLAAHLRAAFPDRIEVVEGDALTVPLPPARAVVGNLPFSVGTPILVRLLQERVPVVVALLQAEVADRLLAAPGSGDYGRLTLLARLHAEVEGFLPVPSAAFEPVPAVGGRVVRLLHRDGPLPVPDERAFEAMTRTLFATRRKQLKNLLPRLLDDGRSPSQVAERADWPADWATRRPEELPPEAYFRLAAVLAGRS
jgi:16S rRNA (adenine1518-N6/adenine1519-N6)-dimethyltransferase